MATQQRIEWILFLFTTAVFFGITTYVGIIDTKSHIPNVRPEFTYPVVHSDSEGYTLLALNLLEGNGYSTAPEPPYTPETHWAPGYPAILAVSFLLFGSVVPVVLLQVLLGGITSVLIFRMASAFTPRNIAVIPALIFSLDLSIAYYTSTIHTDGLFMSLATILFYFLFFRSSQQTKYTHFFLLGILLGVLILIRSIAQYLIVLIPLLYIARAYMVRSLSHRMLIAIGIFVLGALLVVTPWTVRNHDILGEYTVGTIGPKMFLFYYVKDFLTVSGGGHLGGDFAQSDAATQVTATIEHELKLLVEKQGGIPESHYQALALRYIFDDPIAYGKFHIVGTLPYFLSGSYRHYFVSVLGQFKERAGLPHPEHTNIAHHMTAVLYGGSFSEIINAVWNLSFVLIEIAWRALLVLCAGIATLAYRGNQRITLMIIAVFVCYFAFLTGPASLTRYRIVSEPLLLTLASVGGWISFVYVSTLIRRLYTNHRNQKAV